MKSLLILTCITIACQFANAQKNFQPATIVTTNGQTQTGEIDYKNWKENPSIILLRNNKSSQAVRYGVNDVEEFSVAGDRYKRAVVDVYERTNNPQNYPLYDSMTGKKETVFLLTIVSGPKSLYQYTDNVDHFYIRDENGFQFLMYNKYKATKEVLVPEASYAPTSQMYVATNKGYINQLKEYLKECAALNNDDEIKYEAAILRDVFTLYYSCRGQNPDFILKPEKNKVEISILGGASNTSFNVNTAQASRLGRADYTNSTNFVAGAAFDIVFPRQRGRVSLNNELMYSSYAVSGYLKVNTTATVTDEYTFDFGYSYLKLNTMLRYKFFLNNTIIFVNGGLSNGIRLSEVNRETQVHTFQDDKDVYTKKGFEHTRGHELGFIAGAGVRVNRLSLEVRGEKGNGPFRHSGYRANVLRYMGIVGFRLR